jgi:hypothetical protein
MKLLRHKNAKDTSFIYEDEEDNYGPFETLTK